MAVSRPTRARDTLQAHYTASSEIVAYMASHLNPRNEDEIWEPCAGNGDLVDGVLAIAPHATLRLSELDAVAVQRLDSKYNATNVDIRHEDALDVGFDPRCGQDLSFSRIIANPPYGAYWTPRQRRQLRSRFPNLYVRESYGVFLFHALDLLGVEGRLVFIIPDTFLWLNRHESLRRRILETSTIEEIALFPSKFFPNVDFGYSGLCVISLTKREPSAGHTFQLLHEFSSVEALARSVDTDSDGDCRISTVKQSEIRSRAHAELCISKDAVKLGERATESLGEHAEIRTGFYSGNDLRWVRRKDGTVPRSRKFSDVDFDRIADTDPTLEGFNGKKHFIPIIRGGAIPYHKPTRWFIDWSREAVTEYRRKGENPARFQNSSYYFRDGIGVPMVASTRLTGALLDRRLFDQSIVGVFPTLPKYLNYILGFLNSSVATKLIRQINPTANNSVNYLKRLPFVIPNGDELAFIGPVVQRAIHDSRRGFPTDERLTKKVDAFYDSIWLGNCSAKTSF